MFLTTKPNLENSTAFWWTKPEYSYHSSNKNRKLHFKQDEKRKENFGENKSTEFIHPIIENDSPWSKANSIYQAYTKDRNRDYKT
jgi:hypothetical protein